MRTTIDLFKSMAATMGLGHNFAALTPAEQNDFLALVYDRYVEDRALIGTPASCAKIVEHLQTLGVNEIACFVDFGVEPTAVRAAFPQIDALQTQVQSQHRPTAPVAMAPVQHGINGHLPPQQTAPLSAAQKQLWILAQLGDAAAAASLRLGPARGPPVREWCQCACMLPVCCERPGASQSKLRKPTPAVRHHRPQQVATSR